MPAPSPDQPLISIALCVYNGERYLREQLDSILAQDGVRIEVVAVDDQSSDGSLALLQDYAARDPRIRVHENDTNLGHLRSFDRAMSLCTGPLIAPSDQDDIWHPQKLQRLLAALGDSDLAYCDSEYIDSDGNKLGRSISDDLDAMHAGRDPLRFVFQNTVSGHALLVRREVFEASRPFPDLLYHDWWLAMRAAAGHGVVYVDAPLVQFRRHDSACSPLGKKREARARSRRQRKKQHSRISRNRKWLEELLYTSSVAAATAWNPKAHDWHEALQAATDGRPSPLFSLCWRDRASLPPWQGPTWINAIRFYLRCKRKIRRAQREPALTTPLFRG